MKVILAAVVVFQLVAWGVSAFLNVPMWLTAGIAAVVALTAGMFVIRRVGG